VLTVLYSTPRRRARRLDRLTLLERWADQEALDAHATLNSTRPPLRPELRASAGEREDYQYNRRR
jgi:hypothetical protein